VLILGKRKNFSLYNKKRQEVYLLRKALLTYSLHDTQRAEIVYTQKHEHQVLTCIKQELGYTKTDLAEHGEVLIHPGGESPSLTLLTN